jgi:ESF2/ABP1 family protein
MPLDPILLLCLLAAYQNAVREQKMAFEISNAKRERDFYLKQVNQSKGIKAMQERKRKREKGVAAAAGTAGEDGQRQGIAEEEGGNMQRRDFRQREAKPDHVTGEAPVLSSSTLGMIAGRKKQEIA